MLPTLYQNHLQNQLSKSQLLLLNILINLLQEIKQVSLEKLATALPLPILFHSRRKKLQRFLSLPMLNIKEIWFPIVEEWLSQNFSLGTTIYLAIDRTNWNRKNLIMISLIYQKRAIPIYFELLSKLGSSNLAEQTRLFEQTLPLFKNYQTVILGDREFCSVKLATWLREKNVGFCLRLKKNENIELEDGIWCELSSLGLKPGISFFIPDIKVTKTPKISGFNLASKWKKTLKNQFPKEAWFILTNLDSKEQAIAAYKLRFDIEEMFKDFKSGGYNLEDTNIDGSRFISIVIIIALAYSLATFQGEKIKKKGIQKYIGRVKEYGRIPRRHSSFYIGLYSQGWVRFMDDCWGLVQELMKLSPNKLKHYLRGMRAMELIKSAL